MKGIDQTSLERKREAVISIVPATPALTAKQLLGFASNADVIVIIAFATGTTPTRLNTAIKTLTDRGISIFLVSDNVGDGHGILHENYEPQVEAKMSGAFPLQKVNINHMEEILTAIQQEYGAGKKGRDLSEAIYQKYAYQEGEEKPKAAWEK